MIPATRTNSTTLPYPTWKFSTTFNLCFFLQRAREARFRNNIQPGSFPPLPIFVFFPTARTTSTRSPLPQPHPTWKLSATSNPYFFSTTRTRSSLSQLCPAWKLSITPNLWSLLQRICGEDPFRNLIYLGSFPSLLFFVLFYNAYAKPASATSSSLEASITLIRCFLSSTRTRRSSLSQPHLACRLSITPNCCFLSTTRTRSHFRNSIQLGGSHHPQSLSSFYDAYAQPLSATSEANLHTASV